MRLFFEFNAYGSKLSGMLIALPTNSNLCYKILSIERNLNLISAIKSYTFCIVVRTIHYAAFILFYQLLSLHIKKSCPDWQLLSNPIKHEHKFLLYYFTQHFAIGYLTVAAHGGYAKPIYPCRLQPGKCIFSFSGCYTGPLVVFCYGALGLSC